MVQRTTVILTDDLAGGDADETVRFGFDGKAYSIDLSTKNADKLRKLIAPYVEAARRDGNAAASSRQSSTGSVRDFDPRAVRAWAQSNGYEINTRGRVSGDIVAAFRAAGD